MLQTIIKPRPFIAMVLCLITSLSAANENITTGRYSELTTSASTSQLWPMANVVSVSFSRDTRLADAIVRVLDGAGYHLHPNVWRDPALSRLLNLSIPAVHERFDQMAVQEIIHALVGSSLDVLVDPVKRYISFAPTSQLINP